MALFQPFGGVLVRQGADGMTFTRGAQGQAVINQATSNRARRSTGRASTAVDGGAAFSALDQVILSLDATYDLLPQSQQAEWDVAAGGGDWSLCANCDPDHSGKKFFRQLNFNRQALGLPMITIPPVTSPGVTGATGPIIIGHDILGDLTAQIDPDGAPQLDCVFVAQVGQSIGNPAAYIPQSDAGLLLTSGPTFDWIVAVVTILLGPPPWPHPLTTGCVCCCCAADGTPGTPGSAAFVIVS